jgi:hypothetical protein
MTVSRQRGSTVQFIELDQAGAHPWPRFILDSVLMSSQLGVLSGIAAMRQDLWRLAHIAIQIRPGLLAIRGACDPVEVEAAKKLAGRFRRRVRRPLIAYARQSP